MTAVRPRLRGARRLGVGCATAALLLTGSATAGLLAAGGCGQSSEELPFAPASCVRDEPSNGLLHVKVTINDRHPSVTVRVLLGSYEYGSLVLEEMVTSGATSHELPVDEYTATALYVVGPDSILVIDSGKIETSSEEYRDTDCWSVSNGEVDLRLRDGR